jgi:hypothetical protein
MSYGVFRPEPTYGYPAVPRQRLPIGTLAGGDTWLHVSFPTPASAPSGDEEFAVEVRRTGAGGSNPTVRIELWENGVFKATALANTPVTSTTSQVVRGVWNASSLTTADGSNVEAYIYGTTSADGNWVEIGAVEWNNTPQVVGPTVNLGLLSATAALQTATAYEGTRAVFTFPTPTSAPSGDEEFAVEVRRTATGTANPTVRIELWEGGSPQDGSDPTPVTSTSSQVVRWTWDAAILFTADGSGVECRVYGTPSGEGAQVEIGAVEWNDTPTGGAPQTVNLGLLSAAAALQNTTVTPGAVSQTLALQSAASALQNATVTPGAVSQTLALQSAVSALRNATVTPGAVSQSLALQNAAAALQNTTVTPGAVSQNLALQQAVSALRNTTVTPGVVTTNLGLLSGLSSLLNTTVAGGVVVNLGLLSGASALRNITVTPGAVSTQLALQSAAAALLTANVSVGSGPQTVNLALQSAAGALRTATPRVGTLGNFSFPTPAAPPSGQEEFAVEVRRTATGTANPRVRIELWEGGTFRQTALTSTAVTSTTSQVVRGIWDASSLTTTNGSAVECRVYGTPGEDGAQVEIGAVEWNAVPVSGPVTVNLGLLSGTSALQNTTVVPGAITLQLLISPATAGEAETIAQLANRTIDELMSDSTTAGSSLRNFSQTATLGLLSAATALRNATATSGGQTVNLGLLSATSALRNITVTGGATSTQLARLQLAAALLTAAAEIPAVSWPKAVVSLEVVPTATLGLEVVPKATVTLETVPTATLSVETVPKAATDLETVPRVLVGVEP